MSEVHGACTPKFDAVRKTLAASLDDQDVGASAAVYVDGEPVVDIWGGHADAARTTPWVRDTITPVWSTTKTMTALCVLMLADRGVLDVAAPVARYWPEFAAAGKQGVLLRHVLAHTAGLPDWDPPITVAELYDWPAATARLAAQTPRWPPGSAAGYHSLTQGFLLGEVIRRVTGATVGEFFAAEIADRLGADFHIGLPPSEDHRLAPAIAPANADEPAARLAASWARDGSTEHWRRAGIPSAGGYGNARSIGLVQSVLACGGSVHGVRLLSETGCARAWAQQYHGEDRIMGVTMRYGLGFGLFDRGFGWGGLGGSLVMVDPQARLTVAFAMNQMSGLGALGDDRGLSIVFAAYQGLS